LVPVWAHVFSGKQTTKVIATNQHNLQATTASLLNNLK